MHAPSIEIHEATLLYNQELLFDRLSFTIAGGKWTCLLGESGIGKTSLLRVVANLTSEVALKIPVQTSDNLPLQNRLSYIAQQDQLFPWLTVLENIYLGQTLRGETQNKTLMKAKAKEISAKVGLTQAVDYYPSALSGGMKQRVLLARTLMEDKPIVLMDEPFASLDVITRYAIQNLAADLLQDRTVLLVTHDPIEALRLSQHIFIMSGRPARLSAAITIDTPTPRTLTDPMVLHWQKEILCQLGFEKEDHLA